MTPKEKAKDLYNKFRSASRHEYLERTGEAAHKEGKKLALLCVEEILNEIIAANAHADIEGIDDFGKHLTREDYLLQVKQEIEKLL